MAEALEADWDQVHLLPARIEDWIGADHPARYIRAFVDEMDLVELGFTQHEGGCGRPPYSNRLLLRAWLYGYVQKIRSSRALERACCEQMGFIWLCGTHRPDHNSLWRFWRAHRQAIKQVFLQTVKVAMKMDLIGFVAQAVDGTKIQALSTSRGGHGKDGLEAMLSKVEKDLEEMEAQLEQSGNEPASQDRLPKAMANARALREKIRKAQDIVESGEAKYVQPLEPQARRMNTYRGKNNTFGYNAQAVVDSKKQIVSAADVVTENHDNDQLERMAQASQTNTGQRSDVLLADGGYSNGEQLKRVQSKGRNVVMPLPASSKNPRKHPYHSSAFTYEAERDVVICPQGKELKRLKNQHKARCGIKIYRNPAACKDCPVSKQCTRHKYGRVIEINPYHQHIEAHRKKMQQQSSQEAYKQRAGVVEPLFAWIKINDNFKRWSFKGLENVQAQWQWLCAAQNLRKLIQVWSQVALKQAI